MRPLHEDRAADEGLEVETIDQTRYFVRCAVTFEYDVPGAIAPEADITTPPPPSRQPPVDYLYQVGFSHHIDNHEILVQYRARTREEIHTEIAAQEQGTRSRRTMTAAPSTAPWTPRQDILPRSNDGHT